MRCSSATKRCRSSPDVVLVDLFVGNDIVDNLRGRDHFRGGMRRWLDRHNMLVYELPRRLAIVARERRAARRSRRAADAGVVEDPDARRAACQRIPWLTDPLREPPSMSHEAFLELETRHAREICGGGDEPYYQRFWEILDEMRAAAAPHKLAVLLIPDELQVEEPLWRDVSARAGVPLDRDRAQRHPGDYAARKRAFPTSICYRSCAPSPPAATACDTCSTTTTRTSTPAATPSSAHALAAFLRPLLPPR